MAIRPGRCYRDHERPNTRISQTKPSKSFVKGAPRHVISEFEVGEKGDYDHKLFLIAKRNVQVRHNAIEAARVMCVQTLERELGKDAKFFARVRIYPHHILRENALATGAGADRFQQGMKASFGSPKSRAAQVDAGQIMFEVHVNKNTPIAKKALKKASYKLPTPCRIDIESKE